MVCFVLYLFIIWPLGLNYVNPSLIYTILLCLQMHNFWTFLLCACDILTYGALQGLIFSRFKATRSVQQPVKSSDKKFYEVEEWVCNNALRLPALIWIASVNTSRQSGKTCKIYSNLIALAWLSKLHAAQQVASRKQSKSTLLDAQPQFSRSSQPCSQLSLNSSTCWGCGCGTLPQLLPPFLLELTSKQTALHLQAVLTAALNGEISVSNLSFL